jgi:hypothetical protein
MASKSSNWIDAKVERKELRTSYPSKHPSHIWAVMIYLQMPQLASFSVSLTN